MGVNQLPWFGMWHQPEPAGWDQSGWPCTALSRCHRLPSLPGSTARGGTGALLGGTPEDGWVKCIPASSISRQQRASPSSDTLGEVTHMILTKGYSFCSQWKQPRGSRGIHPPSRIGPVGGDKMAGRLGCSAVLKVLILLQTWLHPVASSGRAHEGRGFRMGWKAFSCQGGWRGEGGWSMQPPEGLMSDLHTRWAGCHHLAESCHQPRGLRPRRQGNGKSKNLVLKKLTQ